MKRILTNKHKKDIRLIIIVQKNLINIITILQKKIIGDQTFSSNKLLSFWVYLNLSKCSAPVGSVRHILRAGTSFFFQNKVILFSPPFGRD